MHMAPVHDSSAGSRRHVEEARRLTGGAEQGTWRSVVNIGGGLHGKEGGGSRVGLGTRLRNGLSKLSLFFLFFNVFL